MREAWLSGARRLAAAGADSPRLDSRVLLRAVTQADVHGAASQSLTPEQTADFEFYLMRREKREPVAYIAGRKEFWSLQFDVGPGAHVPRPETETLLEEALRELPERNRPYRVLDLGTGTGCLLIGFLSAFPNATGIGVDISDEALTWARRNVARHRLQDRVTLMKRGFSLLDCGPFDVILANPPYIPSGDLAGLAPEIRLFEPRTALDGGPDGLAAYRSLAPFLAKTLFPGGVGLLEIGAGQHHLVTDILAKRGLSVERIARDLAGIERCAVVRGNPQGRGRKKQLETGRQLVSFRFEGSARRRGKVFEVARAAGRKKAPVPE